MNTLTAPTPWRTIFNSYYYEPRSTIIYAACNLATRAVTAYSSDGLNFYRWHQYRYQATLGHNGYIERPWTWSDVHLLAASARTPDELKEKGT